MRGQRNFLHTADFSVQAGRYAGARAEKLPTDSRFLCLSRGIYCLVGREIYSREQISQSKPGVYCREGREIYSREQISQSKPGIYCLVGREIYSREQISQSKPGICWCEGREIFYRQQISQSKPGGMLVLGQRNCLQTADFSA